MALRTLTKAPILSKAREAMQLKRAVGLVWQSGPKWTLANVAVLTVQGVLPLVSLYLIGVLVDAVTVGVTGTR
jgi:ATP-binding cassette subfamily B protein